MRFQRCQDGSRISLPRSRPRARCRSVPEIPPIAVDKARAFSVRTRGKPETAAAARARVALDQSVRSRALARADSGLRASVSSVAESSLASATVRARALAASAASVSSGAKSVAKLGAGSASPKARKTDRCAVTTSPIRSRKAVSQPSLRCIWGERPGLPAGHQRTRMGGTLSGLPAGTRSRPQAVSWLRAKALGASALGRATSLSAHYQRVALVGYWSLRHDPVMPTPCLRRSQGLGLRRVVPHRNCQSHRPSLKHKRGCMRRQANCAASASSRRPPAIRQQCVPRDEAGLIRKQVEDGAGDFWGFAEAA